MKSKFKALVLMSALFVIGVVPHDGSLLAQEKTIAPPPGIPARIPARPSSAVVEDGKIPPGNIDFTGAPAGQVIQIYKEYVQNAEHATVFIDSRVRDLFRPVTFKNETALTNEEVIKQLEKILLEQAGVVCTRLDGKKISVTFNDALPISRAN